MSRPSFRPRPLDIHQNLTIVRDPKEISADDINQARAIQHSHVALDKDNDQVQTVQTKKGQHEIPVPDVQVVASYALDVKPNFVVPDSYVRYPGTSSFAETVVSYDLDTEDEDWLNEYNGGQNRLAGDKFELMLHKLEMACSQATEKKFQAEAALAAERGVVISFAERTAAVASTSGLTRESAMDCLRSCAVRQAVITAVYEYWVAKRERRQKPLMREYQMPPPVTDTNPYNVFRPREKISRPQTRRKRENDAPTFEKMQEIRRNMQQGLRILDVLAKRERRKRDLVAVEIDIQQAQVRIRHDANSEEEEAIMGRQAKQRTTTSHAAHGADKHHAGMRKHGKHNKKHRRHSIIRPMLPCPPPPMPQMLFAIELDLDQIEGSEIRLPPGIDRSRSRARFGRGGRLVFERCNPLGTLSSTHCDAWVQ